jgi:hypothetical protein
MPKRKTKRHAKPETFSAPGDSGEKTAAHDYKVGYGRPPDHTRFKKGQTGNPKGRPKGHANAKTIASRVISERVTMREGDKAREMTKLEGLLQAHLVKAIKGDARSASMVIGFLARLGLLADTEPETITTLSDEDQAILAEYVQSQTGAAGANTSKDLES